MEMFSDKWKVKRYKKLEELRDKLRELAIFSTDSEFIFCDDTIGILEETKMAVLDFKLSLDKAIEEEEKSSQMEI